LSGRGLCDELITRPEESYRLCCVVVCDLETSRMGAPYIYDISHLRVNIFFPLEQAAIVPETECNAFCSVRRRYKAVNGRRVICSIELSTGRTYW